MGNVRTFSEREIVWGQQYGKSKDQGAASLSQLTRNNPLINLLTIFFIFSAMLLFLSITVYFKWIKELLLYISFFCHLPK